MEAKDRADISDRHSAALIATGGVTATVGGVFITVTTLEPSRTLTPVWGNAWFDIGLASAIIGLILAALGLYVDFRKRERRSSVPGVPEPGPGPAVGGHEPLAPPLVVRVLADSKFIGWRHSAMIAALHVEIENTTYNDIMIDGYEFTYDTTAGQPLWDHRMSNDERLSLLQEIKRRDEGQEHGQPLQKFTQIASRNRISGWYLMPVSRNSEGGTPGCTVAIRDVLGNRYLAKLPRHEPQTYDPVGG